MSYWNRPFFPESCRDVDLDNSMIYDTMVRAVGSFAGIAQAFKAVADHYGWTHIVLLSDDDTSDTCWYGARPFDDVFGHNENYTFTWLRLGSQPTDEQLDDVLQQIRSRTRGLLDALFHVYRKVNCMCKRRIMRTNIRFLAVPSVPNVRVMCMISCLAHGLSVFD